MASLQIWKSTLSPISVAQSSTLNSPGKSRLLCGESDSRKRILGLKSYGTSRRLRDLGSRKFRVCCRNEGGDDQNRSNGEEPTESLFMKELKRRGLTPASLLEDTKRNGYGQDDGIKLEEEDGGFSKRNAVSTEFEKDLSDQRRRSMALNSEGLEGLIPRAKLLLTIGGTFFIGFWPLILIIATFFSALYLYFGPTFVHDASMTPVSPAQYTDPYALLEDERISRIVPQVE